MSDAASATNDARSRTFVGAASVITEFFRWLRAHRGAVAMAGLLSFAAPVTFLAGAASVMREPTPLDLFALVAWFALLGIELWALLLLVGFTLQRSRVALRYPHALALLGGSVAAGIASLFNGRGQILYEQGVVQSIPAMHVYAFVFSLVMALMFFAHLRRSRAEEDGVARLAAAQTAQQDTRRRLCEARLQALQARIDPQLLFEMLDAIRRAYADDPARAERLLDELASFLRAALPRVRGESSSISREAQLAHAYAQLRSLADGSDIELHFDVANDVASVRFPPGVLIALLDGALRSRTRSCALHAARVGRDCQLALALPAPPSRATLDRVRSLLTESLGTAADIVVDSVGRGARVTVKVPYELA